MHANVISGVISLFNFAPGKADHRGLGHEAVKHVLESFHAGVLHVERCLAQYANFLFAAQQKDTQSVYSTWIAPKPHGACQTPQKFRHLTSPHDIIASDMCTELIFILSIPCV
jgi:hypothetical protein